MLPKWMNKTAPMEDEPKSAANALQLQEFVSELTASQGRVRAFIVTLMPGSPDVADVVQETNLRLWKSQARYRPGSKHIGQSRNTIRKRLAGLVAKGLLTLEGKGRGSAYRKR